jgi:hypothetical protein
MSTDPEMGALVSGADYRSIAANFASPVGVIVFAGPRGTASVHETYR